MDGGGSWLHLSGSQQLTTRQKEDSNLLGLVNTSYTIGAIVSGWFLGGPISDYLGRRWGMGIGCFLTM